MVSPFHLPGECDITADVDFAYLREALESVPQTEQRLYIPPLIDQATFLRLMGIEQRTLQLAARARTEKSKSAIIQAERRLVDKEGMGGQYNLMAVVARQVEESVWPFDIGKETKL